VLGFLARFIALWGVSLVLLARLPALERWAIQGTVASLLALVRALGVAASGTAAFVEVGGVDLQIVPDCTPLMPTAGLWAAVIAFPAPLRWKLAGVAGGAAAVWVFNLVRILALVAVLKWWPAAFDFVHVYLWQTVTLLVVCGLFILWLRLQPRPPGTP
jgi:exosortase/archaeosortase family protein